MLWTNMFVYSVYDRKRMPNLKILALTFPYTRLLLTRRS